MTLPQYTWGSVSAQIHYAQCAEKNQAKYFMPAYVDIVIRHITLDWHSIRYPERLSISHSTIFVIENYSKENFRT